jgi:hypothetical protein
MAGWGKGNDGKIPRYLHKGTLKILSNKECENRILKLTGDRHPIHKRRLCTAAEPFILVDSVSIQSCYLYCVRP